MDEGRLLALSGIQHYSFCPRQWALIHLEQAWSENERTAAGRIEHERAHDEDLVEKRGDLLLARALRVKSEALGLYGVCDVVEFRKDQAGVTLRGHAGKWLPYPVEYKHGGGVSDLSDKMQLCAQAISLEEMLACHIERGALFHFATRKREEVVFDDALRKSVAEVAAKMHRAFESGRTIRPSPDKKGCRLCSLKDLCLPETLEKASVGSYIGQAISE